MNNGFINLMPLNKKGEYIRVNPDNGKIAVCKAGCGGIFTTGTSLTTIADVRKRMINGAKLSKWFLKYYHPWEVNFARENPDKYQELINAI